MIEASKIKANNLNIPLSLGTSIINISANKTRLEFFVLDSITTMGHLFNSANTPETKKNLRNNCTALSRLLRFSEYTQEVSAKYLMNTERFISKIINDSISQLQNDGVNVDDILC